MRRWTLGAILGLAALLSAACADATDPVAPLEPETVTAENGRSDFSVGRPGAVYLMSNAAGPNEILVFERAADGSLTAADPVATGGEGTGAGLGNQGALALTDNGRWLVVVNPGSDDVSVLRVTAHGLVLTDRAPSGGDQPISVTVHRDLVYVLNGGTPNSISALRLGNNGKLYPMPGSSRPLSGEAVGPAQIGFSPTGRVLVVTEKGTNMLTTYRVGRRGWASGPTSTPAAGETPFGFAFNRLGLLIVSEAFGGAPDASTVSSYRVGFDGSVRVLDGAVPTTETAACWIAISKNGRYAYSTNGGSGTISGVRVGFRGNLELLDDDGVTGDTGAGSTPLDAAFSGNGRYLYVLTAGLSEVSVFSQGADGSLTALPGAGGLPATANGMAAW
jgi:6-phosphogluconolactonase (cycloisomerase 2 family)